MYWHRDNFNLVCTKPQNTWWLYHWTRIKSVLGFLHYGKTYVQTSTPLYLFTVPNLWNNSVKESVHYDKYVKIIRKTSLITTKIYNTSTMPPPPAHCTYSLYQIWRKKSVIGAVLTKTNPGASSNGRRQIGQPEKQTATNSHLFSWKTMRNMMLIQIGIG